MYRVKSKAFCFTVVTEDIKKLTIRQITRDNVEKIGFTFTSYDNKNTAYYTGPRTKLNTNSLSANPTKWSNTLQQFVG